MGDSMIDEPTPEEEFAWQQLEQKRNNKEMQKRRELAAIAAAEFAIEYRDQLEIFTLRKAYELAFLRGMMAEKGENNG